MADRPYIAENDAARERLRSRVSRLSDEEMGRPLGDGRRVLLVVDAASEEAVRARLAADPWTRWGSCGSHRSSHGASCSAASPTEDSGG